MKDKNINKLVNNTAKLFKIKKNTDAYRILCLLALDVKYYILLESSK